MEVRIPFSHVAGKRLALRYTHSECQNKTKIFFSVTDRKPFVACGFCGVKILPVIGYNTINIPHRF